MKIDYIDVRELTKRIDKNNYKNLDIRIKVSSVNLEVVSF